MPQTMTLTAPNGQSIDITGDHVPSETELHDIFAKAGVDTGAKPPAASGHDYKILGINIHVPAEEKPRLDSNIVGWGDKGAGIAPEDALMGGQAIRAAVKATAAGGALAGVKESVQQASPLMKYEVTRRTLTAMGVPDHYATLAALAISGLKKGAPAEPTPEGPHLDRSVPMRPGEMSQQQIAERVKFGTGEPPQTRNLPKGPVGVTGPAGAPVPPIASAPAPLAPAVESTAPTSAPPPSAESTASRPANALPDQKALNEEALARRRAEYQARTAAPPKPANVKLNAAETSAYLNLMLKGKSSSEAMASVLQQRELIAALGTPTPTPEQTRFPKGQRGKVSPQ